MRALSIAFTVATVCLGILTLSTAMSPAASADDEQEIEGGISSAQYSCDAQKQSFELLPYTHNIPYDEQRHSLIAGFEKAVDGRSTITCHLGSYILQAQIEVDPPGNGSSEGNGVVWVESVSVSGIELLKKRATLDCECVNNDDDLTSLRVAVTGSDLSVERCYQSDDPNGKNGCSMEHTNIEVARKKRKE